MSCLSRVHDPIYGYIPLEEFELRLTDCLLVQRLRGIHQQGTAYLTYPSSTHNRFSHSLGVMKLSSDALEILNRKYPYIFDEFTFKYIKPLIRVVSLWHDVGCGPFSHVSDRIIYQNMTGSEREDLADHSLPGEKLAPHEYMSMRLLKEQLPKYLEKVKPDLLDYIKNQKLPEDHLNIFMLFLKDNAFRVLSKTEPLWYYVPAPGTPKRQLIYYLPLKQIISSDFDVDKMDYIQRDAYVTGVKFGHLDVDGLLENLVIFDQNVGIGFDTPALSAIETLVLERYKLFRWLNFHHTVCFTDEIMTRIIELGIMSGVLTASDLGYKHLEELAKGDIDCLDTGVPYCPVEIIDDWTIINKIRRSEVNCNEMKVARDFLSLIERREMYTSLWKVRDPLDETQQQILIELGKMMKSDLDEGKGIYEGQINTLEDYISSQLKIPRNNLVVAFKPFKPISTSLNINIMLDGEPAKITELSSVVELLYEQIVQPYWELRDEICTSVYTLIRKKRIRSISETDIKNILKKLILEIPQMYTSTYIYIKRLPEKDILDTRKRVFCILSKKI